MNNPSIGVRIFRVNAMPVIFFVLVAFTLTILNVLSLKFQPNLAFHKYKFFARSNKAFPNHHCEGKRNPQLMITKIANSNVQEWPVEVHINNKNYTLMVREDDTILQACELGGLKQLYDCRRGNCLTCSGKIRPDSSSNVVTYVKTDKGPIDVDTFLCEEAKEQGFILTCCSYPTGPGLKIDLNVNDEAWHIQYVERLEDEDAKEIRMEARAKSMKRYSISHPAEWYQDIEKMYHKNDD